MPSSVPSFKPTKLPTPKPTSFFDNQPPKQDPVSVSEPTSTVVPKDVDVMNNTASESTTSASGNDAEIKNDVALESTSASDFTPANEYQCTGEPCPVDTHCRSRYGSCGPGFIYCNAHTIWKAQWNCPVLAPGTRPTRIPTPKPTSFFDRKKDEEDFPSFPDLTPSRDVTKEPTLSILEKPTLPTITKPRPFKFPTSFVLSNKDETANKTESESNDEDRLDEEMNKQNSSSKSQPDSYFQSEGYLEQWGGFTSSGSPNVYHYYTISLCIFIALMCA